MEPVCTAHSGSKVRAYNEGKPAGFPRFFICSSFEWPPRALWPCSVEFHLLIYGSETPAAFLNHFLSAVLFIFHFLLELSDIMCYTAVARKYTPWGFMKGAIPIWKRPKSTVAAALIRRKRTKYISVNGH